MNKCNNFEKVMNQLFCLFSGLFGMHTCWNVLLRDISQKNQEVDVERHGCAVTSYLRDFPAEMSHQISN